MYKVEIIGNVAQEVKALQTGEYNIVKFKILSAESVDEQGKFYPGAGDWVTVFTDAKQSQNLCASVHKGDMLRVLGFRKSKKYKDTYRDYVQPKSIERRDEKAKAWAPLFVHKVAEKAKGAK